MTLAETILRKVQSNTSIRKKYSSPPPEVEETIVVARRPKRKHVRFGHVSAVVDTSPPPLYPMRWYRPLSGYKRNIIEVYAKNVDLLMAIKRQHFSRGKVDSRWKVYPKKSVVYYMNRVNFYKHVQRENEAIYRRLSGTEPRLVPTSQHRRHWAHNRRVIVAGAQAAFVLFPPVPREILDDEAFATPPGITRPRVYITLRIRDHAEMGDLTVELFTDTSPKTCQLFLELVDGDGLGFGYVGTCFFRKVPGLYWAGGDVAYNNGFGCYAQRGRRVPIGAENYHFPHSMADGLTRHCDVGRERGGGGGRAHAASASAKHSRWWFERSASAAQTAISSRAPSPGAARLAAATAPPPPAAPPHPTPTISVSSAPDEESADSPPGTASPDEPRSIAHSDEPSSVFASADATPTGPTRSIIRASDKRIPSASDPLSELAEDVRTDRSRVRVISKAESESHDDSTASNVMSDSRDSERTRSSSDDVVSVRGTFSSSFRLL